MSTAPMAGLERRMPSARRPDLQNIFRNDGQQRRHAAEQTATRSSAIAPKITCRDHMKVSPALSVAHADGAATGGGGIERRAQHVRAPRGQDEGDRRGVEDDVGPEEIEQAADAGREWSASARSTNTRSQRWRSSPGTRLGVIACEAGLPNARPRRSPPRPDK